MKNWARDSWFDETGLPWINPSPNMRNLIQATLYPGIGAIEGTNVSVGRGTDTPFEQIGAPWIDGVALADALNARDLPGIRFYPVRFTPTSSKYANEECGGVFMIVTDRAAIRPVRVGVEIASMLHKLYGAKYELEAAERLFGSKDGLARIRAGEDPAAVAGHLGGRRGALAAAAEQVPALSLNVVRELDPERPFDSLRFGQRRLSLVQTSTPRSFRHPLVGEFTSVMMSIASVGPRRSRC